MDSRLFVLIHEYQSAVKAAIAVMVQSGISLPASNLAWATNQMPGTGLLEGGIRYRKHGYGCEVFLPGHSIDFDFGANGESNGFDLWRLKKFSEGRLGDFEISSHSQLEELFNAEVEGGGFINTQGGLCYLRVI